MAETDKGVRDVLHLYHIFDCKAVILRAFNASKSASKSKGLQIWREFVNFFFSFYKLWAFICLVSYCHGLKINIIFIFIYCILYVITYVLYIFRNFVQAAKN